jgi:hypothetical protein
VISRLAPVALWLCGMYFAFYPTLLSGLDLVPGDMGDARLIAWLLEHGYHWLRGDAFHADLWSPPYFYPQTNAGAYSDILLSAGPFYWPWRVLGLDPLTSFELCFFLLVTLNYLTFYLLETRCLRFPPAAAAFGAFLFAFASPRLVHMAHLQLHTHFWTILALYALFRLFSTPAPRPCAASFLWVGLFFLGIVAQFYGSFYLGWFNGLVGAFLLPWLLSVRDYRRRLGEVLWANRWAVLLWGSLAGLALLHLAAHYLAAARAAGYQSDQMNRWGIPFLTSWWSRGSESRFNLTNGLVTLGIIRRNPWPPGEHALGLGPITYAVAFVALWRLRHRRLVATLLGGFLVLFICVSSVAPGVSLWQHVYHYIPAAPALRALCRIALVMLIPLSLAAAWLIGDLGQRRPVLTLTLIALCMFEQGRTLGGFDKAQHARRLAPIVAKIPPGTQTFLVMPVRPLAPDTHTLYTIEIDAMWVSLETGVPTVSGYSGRVPPEWPFEDAGYTGPTDEPALREMLKKWLGARGEQPGARKELTITMRPVGDVRVFLIFDF